MRALIYREQLETSRMDRRNRRASKQHEQPLRDALRRVR
jgi:hypothetical protein